MKITPENRQAIINQYIECIYEGMDMDDLYQFVADTIDYQLEGYTDEQLETEIGEYYPHLLEE